MHEHNRSLVRAFIVVNAIEFVVEDVKFLEAHGTPFRQDKYGIRNLQYFSRLSVMSLRWISTATPRVDSNPRLGHCKNFPLKERSRHAFHRCLEPPSKELLLGEIHLCNGVAH